MKWNDFQENLVSSFGSLKSDQDFTDVTLACEDQQFPAHKLVLSSCSPFFRTTLKKLSKQLHPVIFMRGLKSKHLEAVLDFIYKGETSVLQEDLEGFLLLAEELQLKGLEGGGAAEEESFKAAQTQNMNMNSFAENVKETKNIKDNKLDNMQTEVYGAMVSTETKSFSSKIAVSEDVERVISEIISKQDNYWTCTICQFKSPARGHLREHAETHIEGLQYPCNNCGKIMRSSAAYRVHLRKFHKDY